MSMERIEASVKELQRDHSNILNICKACNSYDKVHNSHFIPRFDLLSYEDLYLFMIQGKPMEIKSISSLQRPDFYSSFEDKRSYTKEMHNYNTFRILSDFHEQKQKCETSEQREALYKKYKDLCLSERQYPTFFEWSKEMTDYLQGVEMEGKRFRVVKNEKGEYSYATYDGAFQPSRYGYSVMSSEKQTLDVESYFCYKPRGQLISFSKNDKGFTLTIRHSRYPERNDFVQPAITVFEEL